MWKIINGQVVQGDGIAVSLSQNVPPPPVATDQSQNIAIMAQNGPLHSVPATTPVSVQTLPDSVRGDIDYEKVPFSTHYVPLGDGTMAKLGALIFEAGKNLLETIIDESARGVEQEKYSYAKHLEVLNIMFPSTLRYDPSTMKVRIKSYMTLAQNHVQKEKKTGQGQMDNQNLNQAVGKEQQIVCLLRDANLSVKDKQQKKKEYYGSQSRYQDSMGGFSNRGEKTADSLEVPLTCLNCTSTDNVLETEVGMICQNCVKRQGTQGDGGETSAAQGRGGIDGISSQGIGGIASQGNGGINRITTQGNPSIQMNYGEISKRENDARIKQNQALIRMEMGSGTSGKVKEKKKKRRRRNSSCSGDSGDDPVGKMLLQHMATQDKIAKLKLKKMRNEMGRENKNEMSTDESD